MLLKNVEIYFKWKIVSKIIDQIVYFLKIYCMCCINSMFAVRTFKINMKQFIELK